MNKHKEAKQRAFELRIRAGVMYDISTLFDGFSMDGPYSLREIANRALNRGQQLENLSYQQDKDGERE